MLRCLSMTVVLLNNLVHKRSKGSVRVVGSGVYTDSGVSVFAAREDGLLEGETSRILLILELVPDIAIKALAQ